MHRSFYPGNPLGQTTHFMSKILTEEKIRNLGETMDSFWSSREDVLEIKSLVWQQGPL